MEIAYPFDIDGRGRLAETNYTAHIREMIAQILFTRPGERVNRPDFGCGLQQYLFAPNSDELTTAIQYLVQGALEKWLGDLIEVQAVIVENPDARLEVTIQYTLLQTQETQIEQFIQETVQ